MIHRIEYTAATRSRRSAALRVGLLVAFYVAAGFALALIRRAL